MKMHTQTKLKIAQNVDHVPEKTIEAMCPKFVKGQYIGFNQFTKTNKNSPIINS